MKGKFLIVDADEACAQTLACGIQLEGHEARLAANGEEALEMMEYYTPDVVLCDIDIASGMDGYQVCSAMRIIPKLRHTIFISHTGWSSENRRLRCKQAGYHHYLIKPVDFAILHHTLNLRFQD